MVTRRGTAVLEGAIVEEVHAVRRAHRAAVGRRIRRAHEEGAVLLRGEVHPRQGMKAPPRRAAERNAPRLRGAKDIDDGAPFAGERFVEPRRQRRAGGDHRDGRASQRRGQGLQVRGGRDEQAHRMAREGRLHVRRVERRGGDERAARDEGRQHPEEQPVEVMRRHRGEDDRPRRHEARRHEAPRFAEELAPRFGRCAGLAAGARGVETRRGLRCEVQRLEGSRGVVLTRAIGTHVEPRGAAIVEYEGHAVVAQEPLHRALLARRRQGRGAAGEPHAEQRHHEVEAVVAREDDPWSRRLALDDRREPARRCHEGPRRHDAAGGAHRGCQRTVVREEGVHVRRSAAGAGRPARGGGRGAGRNTRGSAPCERCTPPHPAGP